MTVAEREMIEAIAAKVNRRWPSVDKADLIQDGWLGLNDARSRFDPSLGFKFTSFAKSRVHGATLDGMRRRDFNSRGAKLKGKALTFCWIESMSSIDRQQLCTDGAVGDRFVNTDQVDRLLAGLNRRDRLVVVLHHVEGLTMRQTGQAIGLSESSISLILPGIMSRVKANAIRLREAEGAAS